jgi:hypothetical protein
MKLEELEKYPNIRVIEKDGCFVIMTDEFPIEEYEVFRTSTYDIYLHPSHPPVYYQKKWVGKGRYYVGVPGLANAKVVRSPKGNLVTNVAGTWGAVVNATTEGEFYVLLHPSETLRRKKPVFIVQGG